MSMKPLYRGVLLTYTPRSPAARGSAAPCPSPMMQDRTQCGQINLQLSLTPTLHLRRPTTWTPQTVPTTTDLHCHHHLPQSTPTKPPLNHPPHAPRDPHLPPVIPSSSPSSIAPTTAVSTSAGTICNRISASATCFLSSPLSWSCRPRLLDPPLRPCADFSSASITSACFASRRCAK